MKTSLMLALFVAMGVPAMCQNTNNVQETEKTARSSQISKDPFLGKKDKVIAIMKDGQIPPSFPLFEEGMSVEDHRATVFTWLRDHKSLIKEEAYTKLSPKIKKFAR